MAQWSDRQGLSGPPTMLLQPSHKHRRLLLASLSWGKTKQKTVCLGPEINEVNSVQQVCVCESTHVQTTDPWALSPSWAIVCGEQQCPATSIPIPN